MLPATFSDPSRANGLFLVWISRDLAPAFFRREVHLDPAVKQAGTEQCPSGDPPGWWQSPRPDPVVRPETVHLDQQLVEVWSYSRWSVFPRFRPRPQARRGRSRQCLSPSSGPAGGLWRKAAGPAGPRPGVHLNKLGTGSVPERPNPCVSGRLGHQGLRSRAGRSVIYLSKAVSPAL